MFTYKITKDFTPAKVKTQAKKDLIALFTEFLNEKFGEESVAMLQIASGTTAKRELGFIFGEVEMENGEILPITATINPTTKEFYDHTSDKGKNYKAFDFPATKAAYEKYEAEQVEKAAVKAANKERNLKSKEKAED